MRTRSLVAVLIAVAATVAMAQDNPKQSTPRQFIIKMNVVEHDIELVLPPPSLTHDGISIYRGETKAALLKQRNSDNWGKSLSAPMVRTLAAYPAIVSASNRKYREYIRSVVFVDDESFLLSLGFFSGEKTIGDLKASDFDLHTTYFNEGDIIFVRRGKSKFVLVEISPVKADDYGIPPVD